MGRRLSALLTAAVLAVGGGGAFAIAKQVSDSNGNGKSSADKQYRGKKCGNPNKPQGVPPGNPSNADCPPQSEK